MKKLVKTVGDLMSKAKKAIKKPTAPKKAAPKKAEKVVKKAAPKKAVDRHVKLDKVAKKAVKKPEAPKKVAAAHKAPTKKTAPAKGAAAVKAEKAKAPQKDHHRPKEAAHPEKHAAPAKAPKGKKETKAGKAHAHETPKKGKDQGKKKGAYTEKEDFVPRDMDDDLDDDLDAGGGGLSDDIDDLDGDLDEDLSIDFEGDEALSLSSTTERLSNKELKKIKSGLAEEIVGLAEDHRVKDILEAIKDLSYFQQFENDECWEKSCENLATTDGYCRLHYIKNWKNIKKKKVILQEGRLQVFIHDLLEKYPLKHIESIFQDLSDDKEFYQVLKELNIDVSYDETEYEDLDADESDYQAEAKNFGTARVFDGEDY